MRPIERIIGICVVIALGYGLSYIDALSNFKFVIRIIVWVLVVSNIYGLFHDLTKRRILKQIEKEVVKEEKGEGEKNYRQ